MTDLRKKRPRPDRPPDLCGQEPDRDGGGVLRCPCGSLLARLVPGGIELKCKRCKRTVIVPVETAPTGQAAG